MQRRQPQEDDPKASPHPASLASHEHSTNLSQPSDSSSHVLSTSPGRPIRATAGANPLQSSKVPSQSAWSSPPTPKHQQQPALTSSVAAPAKGGPQKPGPLVRSQSSAKRSSSRQAKGDSRSTSAASTMHPVSAKKARTGSSPTRQIDIPADASAPLTASSVGRSQREGPKSPLFFSHTNSARHSKRTAAMAPAETTASMLARIREDSSGGVITLKLPRASVSTTALSGSTPGSWGSSMEISVPSLSPDVKSWPADLRIINDVGVLELLEQDDRPCFLVDLNNNANASRPGFHIHYMNPALKSARILLSDLLVLDQSNVEAAEAYAKFKAWLFSPSKIEDGIEVTQTPYTYANATWTSSTLRRRFRFVRAHASFLDFRTESPMPIAEDAVAPTANSPAASPSLPVTPDPEALEDADYFGGAPTKSSHDSASEGLNLLPMDTDTDRRHPDDFTNQVLQSQPERQSFDWTRIEMTPDLPEHIRFARSVDWASTSLGPIEEWPQDLRAMSNLVLASPHPASMYWGPDYISIYNAAYIELAGAKHPKMLGQSYHVAWSEIWDEIKPTFDSAWAGGQATMKHSNQLMINRHGFLEETFFSWSIVPLIGADGDVVGLYNPSFEDTRRLVNERRMLTLREIGERTATATCINDFWPQLQKGLEYNDLDVPFALIYAVKDDSDSDMSSLHSGSLGHAPQLSLEGAIGAPLGHPAAVPNMDLRTAEDGFAPYIRQSMTMGGAPIILSETEGTLPGHLLEGLDWRGFGDPCKVIVIFPVVPTTGSEAVIGFIVMGANPRRPYDDDYKLFLTLLGRQLATSMASVVLFEEEIKRGQKAAKLAALDRQELSTQLQLRTQEANESEYRFTRMAEFAPVGMFIADSHGHINYCNDMWWQISRHSRAEGTEDLWMNSVRTEDRSTLEAAWKKLIEEKSTISVEFRFKCSQQDGENTIDTWVLMSAFPERHPDGALKSIFGCITDISSQKWAEKVQNERREEAVEMKRQQENFIDITSHEMRNPLSAILQCVDQITNSITAFAKFAVKEEVEQLLEGCLDAANTINLCASHQKRIVDDILTLSKLDSNLLSVTPVDDQPVRVVQRALKMFESELIARDIEFEFKVDASFDKLGIKWAKLDPSRLRQVLINLMTNAIKFTQGREKRLIMVSLGASNEVPNLLTHGTQFFERNDNQRNAMLNISDASEWGSGEAIYIYCSVEDTGPGLNEEELKLLFQRFQQASPRTHVQYGGSGLGLFISRILTEMQGGQIGVSSRHGEGSKFNFYIQCRRCTDPPADYEHISPFRIARKNHAHDVLHGSQPGGEARAPAQSSQESEAGPLYDVLIVEDNIVNQKVLQRQLRNCGNNTFVANHGKEALQTLERSRYWSGKEEEGVDISVILMDLEMPVMDGMTCARRIRELEREGTINAHIPIIAVTAYARPEQIENAKAAGIDDVISKPFRIPDLLPRIEELVGKYRNLSVT
ncbi:histidine kinase-, DNA gyrase b-, and HSP90-like ATPase domain-containing protein [Sarocladium implicatum]|nr:histidine kinase-, DNA gyrase b-, and HSP90-like ATPase domain-containing protein [Sarocladium implicatum]